MLQINALLDFAVFKNVQCGLYKFKNAYTCHLINSVEELEVLENDTQLRFSDEFVLLYVANVVVESRSITDFSGFTSNRLYIENKRVWLKNASAIIVDVASNNVFLFDNNMGQIALDRNAYLKDFLGSAEVHIEDLDISALVSDSAWNLLVAEQDSFHNKFSCIEIENIADFQKLVNTTTNAVHLGNTFLRLRGCFVKQWQTGISLWQNVFDAVRGYGWSKVEVNIVLDGPLTVIEGRNVYEYTKVGTNYKVRPLAGINLVDYIEGRKKLPGLCENPSYNNGMHEQWERIIAKDPMGHIYLEIYVEFVCAWIKNSKNGLRDLEELCNDNNVTVEDFVRCLCNASAQVLQGINHWILRGFYSDDKLFNNIETRLLSSWTTDYDTADGFAKTNNHPFKHMFATMLGQTKILSHHMFCPYLRDGISGDAEFEVIVVNEKCFSRDVAILQETINVFDMVEVGSGAEATVYASNQSDLVLVYTEAQSKRDMLDMFIQHPHYNLPKVYKLSDNVYVMEKLYELDQTLVDENELIRLSKTYQPIGKLNFKGIIDNAIFSALNHLKMICGEKRYRLDFWGVDGELSNIMQRKNGEIVLCDPITTLKMTQEEWEASQ